ncbi:MULTISPECIES: GNAT family N-acetyltransferase [unclassified Pseudomonas]|uniref:GNAT family N-acetyltransferase n=1 Tax=unclassified Pseudomonas TaxID=196821 RepID=UPI0025DCC5AD|nr:MULTISPECIES: GNAT family N-acetyltransferase [unclassified Pseudomonas]
MDCLIRDATVADAAPISQVIIAALGESNTQDYPAEIIEQVQRNFSPLAILGFLTQRKVYVATVGNALVATASLDRNIVRSVFVAPVYQGKGLGRRLMETIESMAWREGFKQLRVPSSITAQGFYLSLGFTKIRDEFHGAERTIIMDKTLGQ